MTFSAPLGSRFLYRFDLTLKLSNCLKEKAIQVRGATHVVCLLQRT
jgi:hypothetical protein